MNRIAAIAAKTVGAGTAAALLSLGVAGVLAQAALPNPTTKPAAAAKPAAPDRRAVRMAVFESEADVLRITPTALRTDLKLGQKVSDLAAHKGMTKEKFASNLVGSVRPRLEQLVAHKEITQAQADKVIDRISRGHIPFWNGLHPRKTAAPTTSK